MSNPDSIIVLDEMVADLKTLVEVESPSNDRDALCRSGAVLSALIERRLGIAPTLVDGPAGPHVHWSGGGEPKVLILGHHDTVFPMGTLEQRPFTVDAGRATGPGVFDMKAGIVQAIHAVAALDDRSGVEILMTCDEEVGAATSKALLCDRAVACGAVLVLEPSADGGVLKTGRKGVGTFEVVMNGRAAHAGLEPHRGINSVIEAAHQLLAIAAIADVEAGTTVTPTVIAGGTAENVVPAQTRIRVDVRVSTMDEAARVEHEMAALSPVLDGATLEILGRVSRPPLQESASAPLFPLAKAYDPSITGVTVGGASDGNFTAALGVPTLDGLGAVGGGAHAESEHVLVATMPDRSRLLAAIIAARCS